MKLERIIAAVEALSEWSGKISSWLILVIIGGTIYEVVMRYFFSNPTDWSYELTTMVYGGYCVLVGAYTHLQNGHIRMDAVYNKLSRRTQARLDFFTGWLVIAYLLFFLIITAEFAEFSWKTSEFSSNSTWQAPLYPFKTAIALGTLLLIVQQVVTMIRNFRESFGTEREKEI
jgi:TRAP-type mannitol/chloroaromatic compound transport system permease small subunit